MAQGSKVYLSVSGSTSQDGESHSALLKLVEELDDGTDAGEADQILYEAFSIAYPSTPREFDLNDGSEEDFYGDPLVMREAVTIAIKNDSDYLASVQFDFGSGIYAWTEPLLPGEMIVKHASVANAYPTLSADGPHIIIDMQEGTNGDFQVLILSRSFS
jgi:hypothetical protein